eukprot:2734876-Lingulodinium_polyedra.AAC.1
MDGGIHGPDQGVGAADHARGAAPTEGGGGLPATRPYGARKAGASPGKKGGIAGRLAAVLV